MRLPQLPKLKSAIHFHFQRLSAVLFILLIVSLGYTFFRESTLGGENTSLGVQIQALKDESQKLQQELETLKNEDTRKTNTGLKNKIAQIEAALGKTSTAIESISDARHQGIDVSKIETDLASSVNLLAQFKYDEAIDKLASVNQKVIEAVAAKAAQLAAAAAPAQDPPPSGSYRRQSVSTGRGTFTVSLIAEETGSVKMITDTANDDTCTNNCPVLPLASYVSRNGGFAGINGSYFCPPDYPSCADKVNSFNTLVFSSRLKKYMNSDQNVYSTNAMVVQNADRSLRFMGQALEWGRDTGIIGGLSNYPVLVSGGQARTTESGNKGPRGFIGNSGGALYIGVVHAADFGDAAAVLATLGLDNAMNLDGGGSSALYYNGKYVLGPGRNLPNAIILAR